MRLTTQQYPSGRCHGPWECHEPRRPPRRPASCRRAAARSPAAAAGRRQRAGPGDLAARFGTPVFLCDEADFRGRCREFREAFGDEAGVFYAAKAFCCRAVLRWVSEEGLGVDVCTGGELEVALQAGVPPRVITLHGSNKLTGELERAVAAGVGHIVVDSFDEIGRLASIAQGRGGGGKDRGGGEDRGLGEDTSASRPRLLVRVTTGVEAAAHEFVATAHDDQKFGFSLASGAADEAVRRLL